MASGSAVINKPAPVFEGNAFVASTSEIKPISLNDYKGKWVVLFFYPTDFTFVCPTEILAFNDNLSSFNEINTELVACSTDSEYSHMQWALQERKQGGLGPNLQLTMLADRNARVAKAYGVYHEEDGASYRGTFLIDPEGKLRQITINDMPVGRSVEETLRLIKAYQFTDKHGEVCPAGFDASKPDKAATIDKKNASKYFSSAHANGVNGTKREFEPASEPDVESNKKARRA